MVKSIINEMLEMTYPDDYYKNVIEPAKTGKGAVPSMGQMLMKSQPFKAVSLPFQEMMNPGKFGSFRSSGTPMARAITGPLSTAVRGLFSAPAAGIMTALTPTVANADEVNMTAEDFAALNQGVTPDNNLQQKVDIMNQFDLPFNYSADDLQARARRAMTQPGLSMQLEKNNPNIPDEIEFLDGQKFTATRYDPYNDPSLNRATTTSNEPMDIEDFLGTSTPRDLGFIGNAPSIQEAVAPVGITDRGRGMPGEPTGSYEMVGGTPVAVGDVLGRQQALEKADFYEEPTRGIDLGLLGLLAGPAGFFTGSNALRGIGLAANIASGRAGRAVDAVSRGLGSLGTKVSGKMRGTNPVTGKPNTQAQYEANRTARQQQNRTDRMIDRIAAGKKTRSNPRDAGTTKAQKDAISAAIQDSYRGGGGGGSSSSGKVVCTMMNERYGFGSFRNKIWMKFHEHHGPEYQKGYHAIFLPLVKIAKGEGKINTAVRKVLEHMGRHVTADMFKIMKGKKRDTLGRIYRAIFEPACHIIGKIKSALGRG
jgi:hypothetical protein